MNNIVDIEELKEGFYGEWVYIHTPEEKAAAEQYLNLWKHFFINKFKGFKIIDEIFCFQPEFADRPETFGLKIQVAKINEED